MTDDLDALVARVRRRHDRTYIGDHSEDEEYLALCDAIDALRRELAAEHEARNAVARVLIAQDKRADTAEAERDALRKRCVEFEAEVARAWARCAEVDGERGMQLHNAEAARDAAQGKLAEVYERVRELAATFVEHGTLQRRIVDAVPEAFEQADGPEGRKGGG